jgi:hypothetical protein
MSWIALFWLLNASSEKSTLPQSVPRCVSCFLRIGCSAGIGHPLLIESSETFRFRRASNTGLTAPANLQQQGEPWDWWSLALSPTDDLSCRVVSNVSLTGKCNEGMQGTTGARTPVGYPATKEVGTFIQTGVRNPTLVIVIVVVVVVIIIIDTELMEGWFPCLW